MHVIASYFISRQKEEGLCYAYEKERTNNKKKQLKINSSPNVFVSKMITYHCWYWQTFANSRNVKMSNNNLSPIATTKNNVTNSVPIVVTYNTLTLKNMMDMLVTNHHV
jgi:hypothetical protein